MPNIGDREKGVERPGDGWLECIGLSLRRDEYPELFEKIGTQYGFLNDETFNLPSEPHTYIYAGGAASEIPETPPATEMAVRGDPGARRRVFRDRDGVVQGASLSEDRSDEAEDGPNRPKPTVSARRTPGARDVAAAPARQPAPATAQTVQNGPKAKE